MGKGQDLEPEPGASPTVSARGGAGTFRDTSSDFKRQSVFELRRSRSAAQLKRPHSTPECAVLLSPAPETKDTLEKRKAERNQTVKKLLLRNGKQLETAKRRQSLFALNKLVLAFKGPWSSKDQGGTQQKTYTEVDRAQAALLIQARFRGYRARKIYKMVVKRGHEIAELAQTEVTYVRVLMDLVKRYKHPLDKVVGQETHRHLPVTAEDIPKIFANIEDILKHHEGLLLQLERAIESYHINSCIGSVLKDLGDEDTVEMYTAFIQNMAVSESTIDRLMKDESFLVWLEERKVMRHNKACLKTLLGNVFQRVMRYPMVLQNMERHTPKNHPDRKATEQALQSAQVLAHMINRNVDKAKKAEVLVASLHGIMQTVGKDELMERQDEIEEIRDGKFKKRDLVLLSRHLVCLERKPTKAPKRPATPTTSSKKTRVSGASTPEVGRLARTPSKMAIHQQNIPSGPVKWCVRLDEVEVSETNTTPGSPLGKVVDRTLVLTVLKGSEVLMRRMIVFETDSQRHFWADLMRQAKMKAAQSSALSRQSSVRSQGSVDSGVPVPGRYPSFRQRMSRRGKILLRTASAIGLSQEGPPSPPSPQLVVRKRQVAVRSSVLFGSSKDSLDQQPPSSLATPRLSRLVHGLEADLEQQLEALHFTRQKNLSLLGGLHEMHKVYEAQAQRHGRELWESEKKALGELHVQTAEIEKVIAGIDEDIKLIHTVGPKVSSSPGIRTSVFFAADVGPRHMASNMA